MLKVVHHQEEPSFTICCAVDWLKLHLENRIGFLSLLVESLSVELMQCDSNAMETLSLSGATAPRTRFPRFEVIGMVHSHLGGMRADAL